MFYESLMIDKGGVVVNIAERAGEKEVAETKANGGKCLTFVLSDEVLP